MRSVHNWSLHTIEDTRNFWTRRMVIYFVCLCITKRFKCVIRGLDLIIYFACLCTLTKSFKCVSPTVWKFGLKLIVRIKNCSVPSTSSAKNVPNFMNLKYDSFNVPQFYPLWFVKPAKSVLINVLFVWITLYYSKCMLCVLEVLEIFKSMTEHHCIQNIQLCFNLYLLTALEILWLHGNWLTGLPEQMKRFQRYGNANTAFLIYLTLNFSIPVFFIRALKIKMRNKVWLICKHFPGLFQAHRWDGKK